MRIRTYYLAIQPPVQELGRLSSVMRRLGDPLPIPHVTVIAPPELSPDLSWLTAVRDAAAQSGPVTVTIGEPRTFGDRVLYLSLASTTIGDLRHRLLEAISPNGTKTHDAEPYVPHLTLAIARRGRALPSLETVRPMLFPIPPFDAAELTVFRRDGSAQPYRAWEHLAFARD